MLMTMKLEMVLRIAINVDVMADEQKAVGLTIDNRDCS